MTLSLYSVGVSLLSPSSFLAVAFLIIARSIAVVLDDLDAKDIFSFVEAVLSTFSIVLRLASVKLPTVLRLEDAIIDCVSSFRSSLNRFRFLLPS